MSDLLDFLMAAIVSLILAGLVGLVAELAP